MKQDIRIGYAQINPTVGDFKANVQRIYDTITLAVQQEVNLLLFPELCLCGYPPEDLLGRSDFLAQEREALETVQAFTQQYPELHLVLGHLDAQENGELFNAASLVLNGQKMQTYHKHFLPNQTVFDEKRFFTAGDHLAHFEVNGHRFGLMICEDIWQGDIAQQYARLGVENVLVLNASPYSRTKPQQRHQSAQIHAYGVNVVYCNQVGGQDELVFDGGSFVLDAQGKPVQYLDAFQEVLGMIRLGPSGNLHSDQEISLSPVVGSQGLIELMQSNPCDEGMVWQALVLSIRDYVYKTGIKDIVLGLSGGIDSAVVLALAVDALGADHCTAIMMPSEFTADISVDDAAQMAQNLGVNYASVPIKGMFESYKTSLAPLFSGMDEDTTEENLQARIRGNLLMAYSNKFRALVLATGNKSELATGYCTLYGDMCGAFAPIKDVYKTMVYRLARWRNLNEEIIPDRIITRPPSAELRPNQTDQDSLPEYQILDAILYGLIEEKRSGKSLIKSGFQEEDVQLVQRLLKINEYKRRQGAPGPKVSECAFGKDWRYPIAQHYGF